MPSSACKKKLKVDCEESVAASVRLRTERTRGASVRWLLFFFNDTATTEIYTLSLHDALPISSLLRPRASSRSTSCSRAVSEASRDGDGKVSGGRDRKSTRLNSSHVEISY